jgi:2-oxoglutarate ferredoxin oxidoreductase subunit gamma
MRTEICISGFGGQGIVLAGYILGKAITLYAGREAVMTQAYGPEARGGASSANIVVSDETVDYPFVLKADILVAMSQEGYSKFRPEAKMGGIVLVDSELVQPFDDDHPLGIPATRIAEELGNRIVTNVVMLGFFTASTDIVSREAVEKAIETTVKPKTLLLNLKAFETGYLFDSLNSGPEHDQNGDAGKKLVLEVEE